MVSSENYDVIIVGAGSAGCVLADRLSEDPTCRVLLVEAGKEDRAREIHIPPGFTKLFKTSLDWAFETEPEPECDGRSLYWPRGKMIGGCSSLNAMLYIRGHRRDYDRWATDYGCDGWSFDEVLPFFRKSQRQQRGASNLHGVDGPLDVQERRYVNPLSERFLRACGELGWTANDDFNGERQEGFGLYQVTQRRGRRCSSADAFLHPARRRPNLKVVTRALVTGVRLDGRRARRVDTVQGDRRVTYHAEHEIVLAAGAVGSPHLLMLSGIGPADHLRELGIEAHTDLPGVGSNLQDHPVVPVIYRSRRDIGLDNAETLWNLAKYFLFKSGPFTSTVCEAGAFVRSTADLPQPDLQFHFIPAALVEHGFDRAAPHGFNFGPTVIKPFSRGRIRLRSADPAQAPRIEAGYYSDPRDLHTMMRAVRLAKRLAATHAFADMADGIAWPEENDDSDVYLESFVRRRTATLYHPACTCAMGPASGPGSDLQTVVAPDLKVHGVDGLRVVDASVMPELIGGNTNAPTIMIAEKAAAEIRGGERI